MPSLLRLDGDGRPELAEEDFLWIEDPRATFADLPEGPVLVPLALWEAERDALRARGGVGVWLEPDEEPEALEQDLATLPVLGLHFPAFTDGRGLSSAAILRTRLGFRGELRALGDVQRDQLAAMRRCGIDAFRVRPDLDPARQAAGLEGMRAYYQGDVLDPRPLYRRVRRSAAVTSPAEGERAADAA
ncbi:MAG: DUF934 domain-containing protein [Pseudomonadales bacterium]|jgi:uncharacterized protein (DUF934 family)|nr:DUF934 domain-containing protein [Pseudomonadales bacterium]